MDNNAIIKITGVQKQGKFSDKIEMTTVGALEETDSRYILRYEEEHEPPYKPTRVKLSIDKDEKKVEMLRTGDSGSLLIIERSKRNLCNYGTEFGDMLMGIYGNNIENDFDGEKGVFTFGYDIDINGAVATQNEVTVELKINDTLN